MPNARISVGTVIAKNFCYWISQLATNLKQYTPDVPFDSVLHSVDAIWQLPANQRIPVIHAYVVRPFPHFFSPPI